MNTATEDFLKMASVAREQMRDLTENPIARSRLVYDIWWRWANFELFITQPIIRAFDIPKVIMPETDFVYRIVDYGHKFSTSKTDMYSSGMSMCKLYNTIEKIIFLLIERLKESGDFQGEGEETQVAFGGHELAERKAFESVINLPYNVVVTNFDPQEWGERYLEMVKRIAAKGYGYPQPTPRQVYNLSDTSSFKGGKK